MGRVAGKLPYCISLERFAHKGDALCVECAIRPSRWTDQEGKPRYEVNLVTQRIHWLQSRSRSTEAAARTLGASPPRPSISAAPPTWATRAP